MENKKKVEMYLNEKFEFAGFEVMIDDKYTIENNELIVYFYNSKEFLINNNESYKLAGNSPLIVDKLTSDIYTIGSEDVDFYINLFYTDKDKLDKVF